MRKIYYIAGLDFEERNRNLGIKKKIKAQIASMCKSNMECEYYYLPFTVDNSFITKVKRCLPCVNTHQHWHIEKRLTSADGLYIRRLGELDGYVIDFLQKIRKENPSIRIVWEIPTYPYDQQLKAYFRLYPVYLKDLLGRKKLHCVVDRIATLTDDKEIFHVKTLKIDNGVDVYATRPRHPAKKGNDVIHCIAVADMYWWHGYERFIEGLHRYYEQDGGREIVFHLVGDGGESPKYRSLVARYKLEDNVIFHGVQYGEALDAIYDQCSLGIEGLGGYRKGIFESASLKSREYLSKGLPFIACCQMIGINRENIYYQVPNDDTPINMYDVLNFYDKVYQEPPQRVISRLRTYAEQHLSMEVAMKEVIKYFQSDER